MLRWRILLGVTFIVALIALGWLDAHARTPGLWLFPLALLIALAATNELSQMFAARVPRPLGMAAYIGNALIIAANWLPHVASTPALARGNWPLLAIGAAIVLALSVEVFRYRTPDHQSERLAISAFAFLYVGALLSFAVQLRFCGPEGNWGIAALVALLVVVKSSDTGAYVVGRLCGRRKLAPQLSPGKTIEGAIGGLTFAVFAAWLALVVLFPRISGPTAPHVGLWTWLGFGTTVGAAGMIGDLAESLLKRDLGRKDSSDWMPGFGGVLDLLDSVLVAAPVAFAWWEYGIG